MSKELAEKAREYIEKCVKVSFDGEFEKYKFYHAERFNAFIAGHSLCEKEMLERAMEGFEEFLKSRWDESDIPALKATLSGDWIKDTWQAATLAAEKRHKAEMDILKETIKEINEWYEEEFDKREKLESEIQKLKQVTKELGDVLKNYYANDDFIMWLVATQKGRQCDPTKHAQEVLAKHKDTLEGCK